MKPNWLTPQAENLTKAFLTLKTEQEVAAFLRDLLTETEIEEFAGRFAAAQSLASGNTQRSASKETGVSIATVTRVNQWLIRGMNGYKTVLDRLNKRHHRKI